jgi:hypothetical protein
MKVMPAGRLSVVNPAGSATTGTNTSNVFRCGAPFRVYPRRVHAVLDQRRLVLYGFMDYGIQLTVRHDFQYTEREFLSRLKVAIVFGFV